jgi:DNA-binding LytR/AlgR family response regulator
MKVIIIEDELLAQAKLETMLCEIDKSVEIQAKINSVKGALDWLSKNNPPDIAFVDIQLSDDHSFEIFRRHPVTFPVIFTTAYDKYLLESFEFNSIDYLLKPITEDKLRRSLDKVRALEQHFLKGNLIRLLAQHERPALERIIARKGTEFIAVAIKDIAYFYTEHKIVFAREFSGRQLIVDKALAELENVLDRRYFFGINRKFIAQLSGIERFRPDNGKVRIHLNPAVNEDVHVSKEAAPAFREWISGA